jgi:hypothetical protein
LSPKRLRSCDLYKCQQQNELQIILLAAFQDALLISSKAILRYWQNCKVSSIISAVQNCGQTLTLYRTGTSIGMY